MCGVYGKGLYLKRNIKKGFSKTNLGREKISEAPQRLCEIINEDSSYLKGDAFRKGGATHAMDMGMSQIEVLRQGGWKNLKTFLNFYYKFSDKHTQILANLMNTNKKIDSLKVLEKQVKDIQNDNKKILDLLENGKKKKFEERIDEMDEEIENFFEENDINEITKEIDDDDDELDEFIGEICCEDFENI